MISKVIHYCWFGRKPLPSLSVKCIESWKKYLPNYIIKEWNEDNFDVNIISYTKEAYQFQKYAFVSDYARFWILYNYGGIYFDVDVEVIKSMDDILDRGSFMGLEHVEGNGVNPGLGIACTPGLGIYKELLDLYATLSFKNNDGSLNYTTVVQYTTTILKKHGLKNSNTVQNIEGIYIYPTDYFCPKDWKTNTLKITNNTCSIHHYSASWLPLSKRIRVKIRHFLHLTDNSCIIKIYRLLANRYKL